ncbi:Elongation factor 1-alpha [Dictyocoela muelleri]|nr:Elongation factor 1-alpha [Dictyocoela muelleri]
MAKKIGYNICLIGHVDSGKSTVAGHWAFKKGVVDARKMEKLKKEASLKGRDSFEYAFVTDHTEAERDRGITITTSILKLETNNYELIISDCPGHQDFIRSMVNGTCQNDCAVAIVPCDKGAFESAITGGTLKDHLIISGVLGSKNLILALNKFDLVPEAEQEDRFNEVKAELKRRLKAIHPCQDPIFIPISAYKGIGIVAGGESFKWYKGHTMPNGKTVFTLEDVIDNMPPPVRHTEKPLRMPVGSVHNIKGIGTVLAGRIESGKLKPDMAITIQPINLTAEVKALETYKQQRTEVMAGENCGVSLKGLRPLTKEATETKIYPGCVVSDKNNNPCQIFTGAKVKLFVIEHPNGVRANHTPVFDLGTQHVPAKIIKLLAKVKGQKVIEENPAMLGSRDSGIAILFPQKRVVMEKKADFESLGKFTLRDSGHMLGFGTIEELYKREDFEKLYPEAFETKKKEKASK